MPKSEQCSALKWTVLLFLPLLLLGGAAAAEAKTFKAAMVMPGVITDKSFNQSGYEAMMLAKEKLGIEVAYSEKVAQPDQPEALADYARRGFDVVIGHGGEFQDSVERIAKRYPDTTFLITNGATPGGNIAVLRFKDEDLAFPLGYIAGKMSESGIGAFIGGQQIQFCLDQQRGFANGFKYARPDGKVLIAWTNDWDDVAKGKEAALTVISQGADMLFANLDNAINGSYQAVREKGKWSFGLFYDAYRDWPDIILQSAVMSWKYAVLALLKIAKEHKLDPIVYRIGHEAPEAAGLGTYNPAVPEELRAEVKQLVKDIIAGKIDTKTPR